LPKKSDQPSWVKEFRKSVKASCPKGWLVIPGRKESMRVQVWKNKSIIGDVTIPYTWKESDWPDALLRIRSAAKAYEESNQRLEIKTCFNIAHTVSSETEINWEKSIEDYREFKKDLVKDSTWRSKYDPVFKNVLKATGKGSRTPLNGPALCKVALNQWQQGTPQRRHMRLALFGFLRFCVQEKQFESTWLPPAVTDKDLVTTKKRIGYPLTDSQILRLLDSFPEDETGNKWRFGFQCMAVYGLRPEDLRYIHTRNGGQEMWTNYEKSKGGKKGEKTEPRRLYPLLVHDIEGPISWHLKEQLYLCEQEGRNLLPNLGKAGEAGDRCKNYLARRQAWGAIKEEVAREKQELTPYSFRHRYAYYGHNRPKADGSYRAPKQVADAMGHTLDTHLLSYSRFQTKDLASAFDETTLLVKVAA